MVVCLICLEENDSDQSIMICCNQECHYVCTRRWLMNRQQCLICRTQIPDAILDCMMIPENNRLLFIQGSGYIPLPPPPPDFDDETTQLLLEEPSVPIQIYQTPYRLQSRPTGQLIYPPAPRYQEPTFSSRRRSVFGSFTHEQRYNCSVRGCRTFCLCHL